MRIRERAASAVSTWIGFITRQPNEWIITATRTSIYRFFYQMVLPYLSIYTLSLGAGGLQLGMVNSIGIGVAGILGPLTGWVIDRVGYKVIYLIGISLLAVSWFLYAISQSWEIIIFGMLAYWVGLGTSMHSCSVICGSSLANEDRATAMSVCESLAAGLLGMIGPMLGAFLVVRFGGVNVEGIRPLFYICLAGTIGTFFSRYSHRKDRRQVRAEAGAPFNRTACVGFQSDTYLGAEFCVSYSIGHPAGFHLYQFSYHHGDDL